MVEQYRFRITFYLRRIEGKRSAGRLFTKEPQPSGDPIVTSAVSPGRQPAPSGATPSARAADQPLRLLLIREAGGDLPWIVQAITQVMAPVELVEVTSLANALWRLGREPFDSVLLDLDPGDRMAVEVCRRHIADIAPIPVLDLGDERSLAPVVEAQPTAEASRRPSWPPRTAARRSAKPPRPRPPLLAAGS
jgi:hypothetical protein